MSGYLAPELDEPGGLDEISVVTAAAFAAVDEPGIESLLGTTDDNLIPVGSDAMLYGDGGSGKTTLTLDLACHLASGAPWLGITVTDRRTVLLVENEGPRPLFRKKLRRKLKAYPWPEAGERLHIWQSPWGEFSFTEAEGRAQLARLIFDLDVDLVIAGPLTQLGMDEAGTLQDVRRFHSLIAEVRERSLRPVAFVLIHHESKAGRVSGAWEGVGDTLLQLQATGHHAARIFVQKARWSAAHHGKTIRLTWAEGDSYSVEDQTPAEHRAEDVWDSILDFVKAHGGTGWGKVKDSLTVGDDYARIRRDAMIEEGVIVDHGKGDLDARGHRYELWWSEDPARPLAIGELAGESSDARTTRETTSAGTRETRLAGESSSRPPVGADDSPATTPSMDSHEAERNGPYDW